MINERIENEIRKRKMKYYNKKQLVRTINSSPSKKERIRMLLKVVIRTYT